jgi:hypothetical protein
MLSICCTYVRKEHPNLHHLCARPPPGTSWQRHGSHCVAPHSHSTLGLPIIYISSGPRPPSFARARLKSYTIASHCSPFLLPPLWPPWSGVPALPYNIRIAYALHTHSICSTYVQHMLRIRTAYAPHMYKFLWRWCCVTVGCQASTGSTTRGVGY